MDELLDIRNEIDEVDKKLTELFEKRMGLVLRVAEYKKKNNLPVLNSRREKEVIEKNVSYLENKALKEALRDFYAGLMGISKKLESEELEIREEGEIYGLLGEKLGHSFSPDIHKNVLKSLDKYGIYNLFEIPKDKLKEAMELFKLIKIKGLNVTIPYKTEVIKFLDEISEEAKNIGAVNTICFNHGVLKGYNTDYIGFGNMLKKSDISVKASTCIVLGSGGAAKAVTQYLKDNKCREIYIVTRRPEEVSLNFSGCRIITYEKLKEVKGEVIINSTPVGMYPKSSVSPVEKEVLANFEVAVDLIYNPLETKFLSYARELGLKRVNGLYMLASQAIASEEIWNNITIDEELTESIYDKLLAKVGKKNEK